MGLKEKKKLYLIKKQKMNYKNVNLLRTFLTSQGKILPRHNNDITVQQQKKLAKAIKQARVLGLFKFISLAGK